jgi:hypothetical protein
MPLRKTSLLQQVLVLERSNTTFGLQVSARAGGRDQAKARVKLRATKSCTKRDQSLREQEKHVYTCAYTCAYAWDYIYACTYTCDYVYAYAYACETAVLRRYYERILQRFPGLSSSR